MGARKILPALLAAAALAGCGVFHPAGLPPDAGARALGGLITDPAGTVDTTHGAVGAQTIPR